MSEKRDPEMDMPKDDESYGQGEGMGQTGGQGPRGGNQSGGMGQGGGQGGWGDEGEFGQSDIGQGQGPDQTKAGNSDWQKKNEGDGEQGSGGIPTA